jgi:hypothetical protein
MLVEKSSAVLQHVSSPGKQCFVAYGLDRDHFDMHNFGDNDALFDNTVKLALDKIIFPFRAPTFNDLLHTFSADEKGVKAPSAKQVVSLINANILHSLLRIALVPGNV